MEEEKSPMTGMTQEEKDEYVMGKAMDIIMGSGDARLHASKACLLYTSPSPRDA